MTQVHSSAIELPTHRVKSHGEPRVSIVTVVRNMRHTIEDTIKSVISQTYQNIEYIVVDGCSTDGTSDIITKYQKHIAVHCREKDDGLYHAMNKGLYLASGALVLFLNGDDRYMPHAVEYLIEQKVASGAHVVSAQAIEIDAQGVEIGRTNYMQYNSTIKLGMPFRHELMLVPTEIYGRIGGYNTKYGILADWDFAKRIHKVGYKVSQCRLPLMFMRNDGVSITGFDERIQDIRAILRDEFPFLARETLERISDPRKWNEETCLSLVNEYGKHKQFCRIVWDYGFRRGFLDGRNVPIQPPRPEDTRLSIILPVYNAESTIERALDSVLRIQDANLELICIDDCSTDSSRDLLRKSAENNPRVRILENNINLGVSISRNRGLSTARGQFVFFLDADDEVELESVLHAVDLAERNNSDVVIGAYAVIAGEGRVYIRSQAPGGRRVFD